MPADRRPAGRMARLVAIMAASALGALVTAGPILADDGAPLDEASTGELSAAIVQQVLAGDRASQTADKQKAYRTARDILRQLERIAGEGDAIRPDQRPE